MSRAATVALLGLCIVGCGRIDFRNQPVGGDDATGSSDADVEPTTPHTASATVDTAGVTRPGDEPDGVHVVFADNTPNKNGDLVIFREGDEKTSFDAYVSTDLGATWTRHVITPGATFGLNAMGGCQDSVDHAFHLTWMDTAASDQYARIQPQYTGGDISGFTIAVQHPMFDVGGDSPGPREVTEIVDANDQHRLAFVTTAPKGAGGEIKLAITTPTAALAPMAQNDWAAATDFTQLDAADALVAAAAPTMDTPASYLVSVSSNVVGGRGTPFVVVAGFATDAKLYAWAITPNPSGTFAVGTTQTLASNFGAGTGMRSDASLSVANTPSGVAMIAYSKADGIHVATFDKTGVLVADAFAQPSSSTQVRHAVISADAASRPAVIYADGSGHLAATLFAAGMWLPSVDVATTAAPSGAWNVSGWSSRTGVYSDAGATNATTFASVYWD